MLKAIHICNSHQSTLHQKLQKSMSLPTLSAERKKYENTTTYKNNSGFVLNFKFVSLFKF